jgi:hypothetical protein
MKPFPSLFISLLRRMLLPPATSQPRLATLESCADPANQGAHEHHPDQVPSQRRKTPNPKYPVKRKNLT